MHRSASALIRLASAIGLSAVACAASADQGASTLFILDASGSMWGRLPDGQTKIGAARAVLGEILEGTPATQPVGLMAYGHRRKGDCTDIELLQPIAGASAGIAAEKIRAVVPRGKTPLSDALAAGAQALTSQAGRHNLVLVSDGIETCNADPCAIARSLAAADAQLTIHVVGYDVDAKAATQLACIASEGRGAYFDAADGAKLKTALSAVAEGIQANAAPPPPAAPETPRVDAAKKSVKLKIAGPGMVVLKLAAWAKAPKYWKLVDPESGDVVTESSATQVTVKPGTYQIVWRQLEHGAKEVMLPMVVTVAAGETREVNIDTGIRLTPPAGLPAPHYYQLLVDDTQLGTRYDKREVAAYYWVWDPVPVPPGDYRLVLHQGDHGWSEVDLGRIRLEEGKLNDIVLDQGINLQWAEAWGVDRLYALTVTDSAGRKSHFGKRGPVILAPGQYQLTLRYQEHGWSNTDWGSIVVGETGYVDPQLNSGITFSAKDPKPRHVIYATNLDSGAEASITNHWGPFPLPAGRYRLDIKPDSGSRFTIAEEVEIPPATMVEAQM